MNPKLNERTYFDVPVNEQLLCTKSNVLVLEFVARQQLGAPIIELQIVTFYKLLEIC